MQKVNQQQKQAQATTGSGINRSEGSFKLVSMLLFGIVLCLLMATQVAQAGQGCPFDDGSCRDYCNQQGCNMGYCGHFAWIQCICRKCGDEWSWYDKVRYNPDKTVNQTELDSLKLNGTAPIIITNSSEQQQQQQQVFPTQTKPVENKHQTLTTLLIPDLSETNGKLDLNDIPDENSDKFLDYLTKNHEKLVQATAVKAQESAAGQGASISQNKQPAIVIDLDNEEDQEDQENQTPNSEETIEIQISTSNNNSPKSAPNQQAANQKSQALAASVLGSSDQQHQEVLLKKLLTIANVERPSEID